MVAIETADRLKSEPVQATRAFGTFPESPQIPTSITETQMRVKGQLISVPSVQIDGKTVVATGKCLRMASLHDEDVLEGETVSAPEPFIAQLKNSGLKVDIFTFGQQIPDVVPRYNYHLEWDSLAVMPITTYGAWWQRLTKEVRHSVKQAARLGVVTREAEFTDTLIEGIVAIYDESSLRQGRPFWHYKKGFSAVKQLSRTYLDRSIFIGAYVDNELVGFMKIVKVGIVAHTFHVISMMKHFAKRPTNALIAKAVEICAEKGIPHLVYGNFIYRDPKSSLAEFKRRNGFREVLVPRYYVPTTRKGEVALRLGLHRGAGLILPSNIWRALANIRTLMWKLRHLGQRLDFTCL